MSCAADSDSDLHAKLLDVARRLRYRVGLYDIDPNEAVSYGWEALRQLEARGGKDQEGKAVASPLAYAARAMMRWLGRQIRERQRQRLHEGPSLLEEPPDPSDDARKNEETPLIRVLTDRLDSILSTLPPEKAALYRYIFHERYESPRTLNDIWEEDLRHSTSLTRATVYRLVNEVAERFRALSKEKASKS